MRQHTDIMNNELWKKLKKSISMSDLIDISEADCGYDKKEHYSALINIYKHNKMPTRLHWEPHEVLSLVKWSDCTTDNKKLITQVLFCTYLLLEAHKSEENLDYIDGGNQDIIIAIDCANLLGSNWLELLKKYLHDLYNCINKEMLAEELIYFSLGNAIVSLLLSDNKSFSKWSEQTLQDVNTIEETEFFNKNDNILGYTYFDSRLALWQKYLIKYDSQLKKSTIGKLLTNAC